MKEWRLSFACLFRVWVVGLFFLYAGVTYGAQWPVLITEIQASNDSILMDVDGDASDWIELYNPTSVTVDLVGWRLTDDATSLSKWVFPTQNLPGGEYLVVFASGKNRANAGQELHTNFKLEAAGEYLALVAPDATIVQSFQPQFPPQRQDISYGVFQDWTVLVPEASNLRYRIPDVSYAGTDFISVGYDDSTWVTGVSGIGFGESMLVSALGQWTFDQDAQDSAGTNHGSLQAEAHIVGDSRMGIGSLELDGQDDCALLGDPENLKLSGPITLAAWIRPTATDGLRDIIAKGYTTSPSNGEIFLRINNGRYEVGSWDGGAYMVGAAGASGDVGQWVHLAGMYDGTLWKLYRNGELIASQAGAKGAIPVGAGWAIGARGTGTERFFAGRLDQVQIFDRALSDPELQSMMAGTFPGLRTNIEQSMRGVNASLWTRLEFYLTQDMLARFDAMTLRMRYEDGFVAWLNGTEVGRRNAPDVLSWDARATSDRPSTASETFESLPLLSSFGVLQTGKNVLAIQGLNDQVGDGQFFLLPELIATGPSTSWLYFGEPTPGQPNQTGYSGLVEPVQFSVPGGYCEQTFQLSLSCSTPQATIRYTLDGSIPTETTGLLYPGTPVTVSKTSIMRASAFRQGWLASKPETHTYLFLNQVIHQPANPPGFPSSWGGSTADYEMDPDVVNNPAYSSEMVSALRSIPTWSLVLDPDDIFGPQRGIYTNYDGRGESWERPVSLEVILPDGTRAKQENAGLRMYGSGWRATPKKTMRIIFRSEYGASRLQYPLFPDRAIKEFDSLVLRAQGSKSWQDSVAPEQAQYIHDNFARDLARDIGKYDGRGAIVHLYINGLYWGLYNPVERPDAGFGVVHFGGKREDYDAINRRPVEYGGGGTEAIDGDRVAWDAMMALTEAGLATQPQYEAIQQYLDMDQFIDLMLIHQYMTNHDGPYLFLHNNMRALRKRDPAGPFIGYVWDMEYSLWDPNESYDVNPANIDIPDTLARVYARLCQNPEFRLRYADHVWRHFFNAGAMTPGVSIARWEKRAEEIQSAILGESARWGDLMRAQPYTRDVEWAAERKRLVETYFPARTSALLAHLKTFGLYPGVDAPKFTIGGLERYSGSVVSGSKLVIINPSNLGTVYFTLDGSDPRLTGGAVSPAASSYLAPMELTTQTLLKARVLKDSEWSALSAAQYALSDSTSPYLADAWFSRSDTILVRFSEAIDPVRLTETGLFSLAFGTGSPLRVDLDSSETVRVRWAEPLESRGYFLTVRGVSDLSGNVMAEVQNMPVTLNMPGIVLSELMFAPSSGSEYEFIEFHNPNPAQSVDLSGCSFYAGVSYVFPTGSVVPSQGYAVLTSSADEPSRLAFRALYGLPDDFPLLGPYAGRLANEGETLRLIAPDGRLEVLGFEYQNGTNWPIQSCGVGHSLVPNDGMARYPGALDYGGNWRTSAFLSGSPGSEDPQAPGGFVLNEFSVRPGPSGGTGTDNYWLELSQTLTEGMNTRDWFLSDDPLNLTRVPVSLADVFVKCDDYWLLEGAGSSLLAGSGQLFLIHRPVSGKTRVADAIRFQPTLPDMTVARFPGRTGFWRTLDPSPQTLNTTPNISLVISEIMYHPPVPPTQPELKMLPEYVQVWNPTSSTVVLADASGSWRLTGGIEYVFPAETQLLPGEVLLVTPNDPNAPDIAVFRAHYGMPTGTGPRLFGPWQGQLSNTGERIALEQPLPSDGGAGPAASWAAVDEVVYFHQSPWPVQADGLGSCLRRVSPVLAGNDPLNWVAADPSPVSRTESGYRALVLLGDHGWVEGAKPVSRHKLGETVTLKAQPAAGYAFSRWEGCPEANRLENPLTVQMEDDRILQAVFFPSGKAAHFHIY